MVRRFPLGVSGHLHPKPGIGPRTGQIGSALLGTKTRATGSGFTILGTGTTTPGSDFDLGTHSNYALLFFRVWYLFIVR